MYRRRFLKYAGTAGLAVAGFVLVGYELQSTLSKPSPSTKPSPPTLNARFSYKTAQRTLKYIVPHSGEEIQFINQTDVSPSTAPVSYEWYVDGTVVGNSRDYTCTLPETITTGTPHTIALKARSATAASTAEEKIDADANIGAPDRKLRVPIKGIVYSAGIIEQFYQKPPTEDEMTEHLSTIHNELRCNAISIWGDQDDNVLKCARKAIDTGFELIVLNPFWINKTPDQWIQRMTRFAKNAET